MRMPWLALLFVLWATAAPAGPWPRERGQNFVAISATGQVAGLWAERGLGGGRWLVLDGWVDRRSGEWLLAASHHAALRDRGRWRLAWSAGVAVGMPEAGIGIGIPAAHVASGWQTAGTPRPTVSVRVGGSLGAALVRPWPGWAALDLRLETGAPGARLKAEGTLGYRLRPRLTAIGQVQAELARGAPAQIHLAPSAVWQPGGRVGLELGLRHGLHDRRTQLKLGSWLEF